MSHWDEEAHGWVPNEGHPPGPNRYSADRETRLAHGILWFLSVSFLVAAVAVVFVVTVTVSRHDKAPSSRGSGTTVTTLVGELPSIEAIGAPAGSDVARYIDQSKSDLDTLEADLSPRVAVISLDSYVSEIDARKAVGPTEITGFMVAAPGGTPTLVTDGLAAWSKRQRQADVEQRDAIAALIPTSANDPEYLAFYKKEVARLDRVIGRESATSAVVFAAVVKATPKDLVALVSRPGIRLVDVGPVVNGDPLVGSSSWRGLRPEEKNTAGDPMIRPVEDGAQ